MLPSFRKLKGYVSVFPMKSQDEFETNLHWFCKEVGVPVDLILDRFSPQTKSLVHQSCDKVGTALKTLDHTTPWANQAEL